MSKNKWPTFTLREIHKIPLYAKALIIYGHINQNNLQNVAMCIAVLITANFFIININIPPKYQWYILFIIISIYQMKCIRSIKQRNKSKPYSNASKYIQFLLLQFWSTRLETFVWFEANYVICTTLVHELS